MDLSGEPFFDYVREFFDSGVDFLSFTPRSFEVFVHGSAAYQIGQYDEAATLGTGEEAEWHEHFFVRWVRGDDGVWRINRFVAAPREAPPEG
jgi:ketosteroid isomerase-like protein